MSVEAGIAEPVFEDRYGRKAASHTGFDVGRDGRSKKGRNPHLTNAASVDTG